MESNQNLIRANKQPARNAMETGGAKGQQRRLRVSQTASIGGAQTSGRLPHTARSLRRGLSEAPSPGPKGGGSQLRLYSRST